MDSRSVLAASSIERPLLIRTLEAAAPLPVWHAADLLASICPLHFSNIIPASIWEKQRLAVLGNLILSTKLTFTEFGGHLSHKSLIKRSLFSCKLCKAEEFRIVINLAASPRPTAIGVFSVPDLLFRSWPPPKNKGGRQGTSGAWYTAPIRGPYIYKENMK